MNLVERLRFYAKQMGPSGLGHGYALSHSKAPMLTEAADEIDRLRKALYSIIELDHHNMGPESRATKLARDALTQWFLTK